MASTVGALVAKLATIPQFMRFEKEADEINGRTADRIRRLKEQDKEITKLQAQVDKKNVTEEKSEAKFAAREEMRGRTDPNASFVEKAAASSEMAAAREL